MLSVIPAGIFSRLRIFLGRLKPHALPVARRHIVLGSIGAGTGLAVTSMFSHWLLGEVNLWFIAPMGASAVLLFGVPSSPLAQPWSIVGGNVLSALIGVTVGMLVPDAALACGLAAALAIAGMYLQIAGKILRDPAAKAPVAFLVTDNRHHQIIAAQAAVFRQLLLQNGEEALLLRLAARAGIDPHHHQIPRAGQSEAGIFNHHMVGFVFMNNLVTVAFWYLEGAQHGAMGGIQQGFDLLFRTAFNQVKR